MQELLETREKEAQELIAMSVVVHFCNEVGLKLPLKMLEAFFAGNYTGSSADNLWSHLIKFNRYSTNNNEIAIYDVVKFEEQSKIKHKLSSRTEESRILEKYVLWLALLEKEEGLPEDLALKGFQETSWEEVKNCAKKVFPARGFSVFAGGARDFTHIMEAVETKIDYANATEDLENCIQIYLSYLWENAEVFRKTNNFVAFCRKYTKSKLDKEKDSKLLVCAQQMFAAVMQQEGEETSENLGLIKSVQQSNYRIGKMFDCIYEKSLTEPSKTKIEIHAIAVSRNESQRLSANGGKLNIRELQFHRIAVLEISEHEKMVALIPLDKFVLLILNFERHAKTVVYSLANATKPCLSIPFGKTVASASFDCKARLLAIQPDMEPGIIHLFKFGEDYKSRQNLKSVDLNKMFLAESCVEFCLQPNSKFLWFLQEDRVRKIDYKNGSLVNKAIQLDNDMHNVKLSCTPDGGCLLAVDDESRTLPIMTDTGNLLEKTKTVSQGFQMFQTCSQMIATQCKESCMSVYQIIVTGAQHETKLNKEGGAQNDPYLPDNGKELQNEHWIDYIYWMFTKFPCDDLLVTNQLVLNFWFTGGTSIGQSFNQKLNLYVSSIWNKIRLTKKPTNFLNIRNSTITSKMSIIVDKMQIASDSLSWFMKKLITFIPVQIARCQSNAFIVLENGMPVSLDSVEDAFHLSEKINLSFYESIFSAWVGKIKVISSMGKQTTGKSFTLNHVTGSSFNISGARCTDGCWLTVKEQNDCLYVILDFEGLGTIERTEQDDMLLSLFNSSLSTITIFKTEKRIERDIDKLFSKMNMGSDQLKGTDKIFKGKFLIAINDVARQDVKDASKEFEEKISNIVSSSENNFIKKLYNSDFEIMALPAFESSNYYVSMSTLASIVQNEIKHVFESGSDFLSTLKLLMAKLATNDFTPLDRQQINERVRALRSYLAYAKTFGQISDHLPKKSEFDLKSFDDSNFSIALEKSIELPFVGSLILNDRDVVIENNQLDNFVLKFLTLMELTPENCCDWREGLEAFVSESITFRFERINCWLEENLKKWKATDNPEYDDIINVVIENLESSKLTYLQTYKFCGEKCSQCFLKCTSIISHKGDHKCSTSHHCSALCDYCSEDANGCKMSFGHDGKHVCAEVSHVCCEPCKFKEVNNCTGECQKMTGHIDEHQCSEKRHPCIELCSLDGCEGRCVVNCDEEHTVHKCTKEECIIACCVPNCTNKCAALDHFHGSELSTIYSQEQQMQNEAPFLLDDGVTRFDSAEHFCGKEHSCGQDCDKDGFCYKIAEKQIGDKQQTFEGQRQTFTYDVVYVESGKKNQCPKKIKPFEKHHEGDHACSKTEHFCTVICPTCESICSKTVNHEQDGDLLHKVSHTNMLKCYLISEQEDIDVSEASGNVRKYKAGEEAKAEMCHVFCTAMGRGHVHIVECDSENPDACVYSAQNDGRRHQTRKYYPYPEQPKDEMKHDAYWALIGFEDPCQKTESDEFQKCPAHCAAEIHETNNEKIFCEMPLWHEPVKTLDEAGRTDGIITKEGHVFPCNHPSGFYHFVLCLDDSGSMGGDPWADLVSAVQTFVTQRIRTSTSDRLSIVIYNHVARTVAEYQLISNFTQSWLQYVCGGTDFAQGLLLADNIIGKHASKSVMPILIFMSDGQCGNGELEMGNIAAKYRVSSGLQVYTMGFGYADFSKLKELARVGYGQYLNAVSGMDLKALFVDISAKHPPTIGIAL